MLLVYFPVPYQLVNKLPESILTVWRFEAQTTQRAAFIGERAFWRWPQANLKPLLKGYGLFGLIVVLPIVAISLMAMPTTTIAPGGEIIRGFSGQYLSIAAITSSCYLAIPLVLGLRRRTYWRAEPGILTIAGEKIPVELTVEFKIVSYDHTTRHGQGIQKIQKTRRFFNIEIKTPKYTNGKILATFHENDMTEVSVAVQNLAKISGAGFSRA